MHSKEMKQVEFGMTSIDTYEPMLIKNERRNYNLDLLKIFACVAIVGLHTLQKDLSVLNSSLYYCCSFAVPAFFMSSGYILLRRSDVTVFYVVKKIGSILRIVLIWSLVIYAAETLLDILRGEFGFASLAHFPTIVVKSLLQKGHLWQFWYLGALMILYAFLPLLFKLKNRMKYIWAVCLIVGFGFQATSYIYGEPIQKYFIQTFRLWTWVQYFVLGRLLAGYKTKITVRLHGYVLIALTVLVVLYQNFMGRFSLHNLYAEYFYDDILIVVWVISLFTFVMRLELKARVVVVIKQLAPITTGVYIVRPLLIKVSNTVFLIDTISASLLYFAGILVLSAVICFVIKLVPGVHRLIEI